jgi:hypothetical protein
MSAMAPKIVDRPLAVDPKQTFESALEQVRQGRAKARSYRTPIAAGRRPGQSAEAAEKQARCGPRLGAAMACLAYSRSLRRLEPCCEYLLSSCSSFFC